MKINWDLIYIQAKRYSSNCKIGQKDLQAFVGAMERVQKGFLLQRLLYTKETEEFIKKQQKKTLN